MSISAASTLVMASASSDLSSMDSPPGASCAGGRSGAGLVGVPVCRARAGSAAHRPRDVATHASKAHGSARQQRQPLACAQQRPAVPSRLATLGADLQHRAHLQQPAPWPRLRATPRQHRHLVPPSLPLLRRCSWSTARAAPTCTVLGPSHPTTPPAAPPRTALARLPTAEHLRPHARPATQVETARPTRHPGRGWPALHRRRMRGVLLTGDASAPLPARGHPVSCQHALGMRVQESWHCHASVCLTRAPAIVSAPVSAAAAPHVLLLCSRCSGCCVSTKRPLAPATATKTLRCHGSSLRGGPRDGGAAGPKRRLQRTERPQPWVPLQSGGAACGQGG